MTRVLALGLMFVLAGSISASSSLSSQLRIGACLVDLTMHYGATDSAVVSFVSSYRDDNLLGGCQIGEKAFLDVVREGVRLVRAKENHLTFFSIQFGHLANYDWMLKDVLDNKREFKSLGMAGFDEIKSFEAIKRELIKNNWQYDKVECEKIELNNALEFVDGFCWIQAKKLSEND